MSDSNGRITWTDEQRKLADLRPWERNPREITGDQAERLVDSVESFGQVETLAIGPDDELYNGHQRLKVLSDAYGPDYEVSVRVASRALTEKEREKLTVYLHKGAAGNWDFDALANGFELDELLEWGFEAWELGVEDEEPPGAGTDTEPQTDRADELRELWQVEPGQMWRLPSAHGGEHRLICGDCTDADVVARVMGGDGINLGFTSPPYAEQRKYDANSGFSPITPDDYVGWFQDVAANVANHIADDGLWFVNICPGAENRQRRRYVLDLVVAHLSEKWGWLFVDEYAWPSGSMPLDPRQIGRFKQGFEIVYGFSRTGDYKFMPDNVMHESDAAFTYGGVDARISHDYQGSPELTKRTKMQKVGPGLAYPSTLLSKIGKDKQTGHAAAFPVGLPSFFIKAYTDESDTIYEPFAGSGTTIIACENLARQCRAIEISPAYCAVILQRYADHTNLSPELVEA